MYILCFMPVLTEYSNGIRDPDQHQVYLLLILAAEDLTIYQKKSLAIAWQSRIKMFFAIRSSIAHTHATSREFPFRLTLIGQVTAKA